MGGVILKGFSLMATSTTAYVPQNEHGRSFFEGGERMLLEKPKWR
jgi:hypothetical protein